VADLRAVFRWCGSIEDGRAARLVSASGTVCADVHLCDPSAVRLSDRLTLHRNQQRMPIGPSLR
jgi:hypothetical protein